MNSPFIGAGRLRVRFQAMMTIALRLQESDARTKSGRRSSLVSCF
jgi:hypothetical protein